jgi:uncharacterized membrane protein
VASEAARLRIRLIALIEGVRDSYWFLPALFALAGAGAAVMAVLVDLRLGEEWLGGRDWLYGSRPSGAREVLSTIAGSTITVAGVVFSVTLAAVTYASGQYGPRLLTMFARDKGNQATLGVFIGAFLYCLVVLRTIRSAEETRAGEAGAAFVPHIGLLGGLGLAVASIAVLIYFFHHVTETIHINNVIARLGRRLLADVREGAERADPSETGVAGLAGDCGPLAAASTGYIAAIDHRALLEAAERHGLVVRLLRRPGHFVHRGRQLADAAPADRITEEAVADVNDAMVVGDRRTPLQDPLFYVDELVEIAVRALSPGVSDPFTAMACIDWLGAAVSQVGRQPRVGERLTDDAGTLRVEMPELRFEDYLRASFGRLRPYVAADSAAARHALATLAGVALDCRGPDRVRVEAERRCLRGAARDTSAPRNKAAASGLRSRQSPRTRNPR